jgi:hypothetical protein
MDVGCLERRESRSFESDHVQDELHHDWWRGYRSLCEVTKVGVALRVQQAPTGPCHATPLDPTWNSRTRN